jgi:hypothetical protein
VGLARLGQTIDFAAYHQYRSFEFCDPLNGRQGTRPFSHAQHNLSEKGGFQDVAQNPETIREPIQERPVDVGEHGLKNDRIESGVVRTQQDPRPAQGDAIRGDPGVPAL